MIENFHQIRLKCPRYAAHDNRNTDVRIPAISPCHPGFQWGPFFTQTPRVAEHSILGAKAPEPFFPPLKPAGVTSHLRHSTRKGGSMSVEPKPTSDYLDFRVLRTCSTLEKIQGELLYRCASCLWYYPSLVSLQTHIQQGWKEGFSCRVYYKKLKEVRCQSKIKRLQGGQFEGNDPPHGSPFSPGKKIVTLGEDVRSQGGTTGETEQRNRQVQQWLAEIEGFTGL